MNRTVTAAIAKTEDDPLYQSERYWSTSALPAYRFPVTPAGLYQVTFKFAEHTWTAPNKRLFNVKLEGVRVARWFDIFVVAGGKNVAVDQAFTTLVTDGELNIDFVRLSGFDIPKVEAIEVRYLGPAAASSLASTPAEVGGNTLFIKAVGPDRAANSGNVEINILGENFQPGAQVTLGGVACANVRVLSSEEILCDAPAGPVGAVDVTIFNPDGQTATLAGGFTYYQPIGTPRVYMPAMALGAVAPANTTDADEE